MANLMDQLTDFLFDVKARPVTRRLERALRFPVPAGEVDKVLVILPRNLNLMDRAMGFVQSLRKTFPGWRVELFDVDKLGKGDLNRIQMPRTEILQRLREAGYHLVVDLNEHRDRLSAFITLMTEAPYRLHLHPEDSPFYNMAVQPQAGDIQHVYTPLLSYLRRLFIRD